jgi:hypothetical protein
MRTNQNKRMRGRNRGGSGGGGGKSQNPLSRVYESNGPDVKIRGSASHIAEKYIQLARDAQSSGDPIAAEGYYQHAEHYFRLIAAAQEQYRQNQPFYQPQDTRGADDSFDDGDDDGMSAMAGEPSYGPREPHLNQPQPRDNQPYQSRDQQPPYPPREAQPYVPREQPYVPRDQQQHYSRPPQPHNNPQPQPQPDTASDVERLPSFITGGGGQPQQGASGQNGLNGQNGQNGHDGGSQGDRFPLHRRRRRHRGPRSDLGPQQGGDDTARPPGE